MRYRTAISSVFFLFLSISSLSNRSVFAQDAPATPAQSSSDNSAESPQPAVTVFPHSNSSRWWISGQGNIILQWHPSFPSKYSGPNSLSAAAQSATSRVFTLYTGYELTNTTEVFVDIEDSTGGGIGNSVGLAGYTNLDVVRTAAGIPLSHAPYLARALVRQIIPLSSQRVSAQRSWLGLATSLPKRRLEFWIGKFSIPDFFDTNGPGSDSHLQFLNWTVDNSGAYDYAANTRGYTDGAMVEYDDGRWSARFAEALMPKVANGTQLDADLARSREENFETDYHGGFLHRRDGVIRLVAYLALGGIGFLLGDGALNYGREKIFEGYYTAHVWRGTFISFDLQHINNPGYNKDRGPVLVPAVRLHVDF